MLGRRRPGDGNMRSAASGREGRGGNVVRGHDAAPLSRGVEDSGHLWWCRPHVIRFEVPSASVFRPAAVGAASGEAAGEYGAVTATPLRRAATLIRHRAAGPARRVLEPPVLVLLDQKPPSDAEPMAVDVRQTGVTSRERVRKGDQRLRSDHTYAGGTLLVRADGSRPGPPPTAASHTPRATTAPTRVTRSGRKLS